MPLDIHDLNMLDVLQTGRPGQCQPTWRARSICLPRPCAQRLRKLEMRGPDLRLPGTYRSARARAGSSGVHRGDTEGNRRAHTAGVQCRHLGCAAHSGMSHGRRRFRLPAEGPRCGHADYRTLLGSEIGSLPMVQGTHSYFVMEEVKDSAPLPLKPVRAHAKRDRLDCRAQTIDS